MNTLSEQVKEAIRDNWVDFGELDTDAAASAVLAVSREQIEALTPPPDVPSPPLGTWHDIGWAKCHAAVLALFDEEA
jgi:hypothetical protein